jgi:hypothetical protein
MSNTEPTTAATARARSARTLAQGAAVTALVALATVVVNVVGGWTGDEVLSAGSWIALGTSAAVAVLTSVASYVAAYLVPPRE